MRSGKKEKEKRMEGRKERQCAWETLHMPGVGSAWICQEASRSRDAPAGAGGTGGAGCPSGPTSADEFVVP
jgi:hypothetical protein